MDEIHIIGIPKHIKHYKFAFNKVYYYCKQKHNVYFAYVSVEAYKEYYQYVFRGSFL